MTIYFILVLLVGIFSLGLMLGSLLNKPVMSVDKQSMNDTILRAAEQEQPDPILELLEVLSNRYREREIPPCPVCGDELSIGSVGGGKPTRWHCSSRGDDPDKPGFTKLKEGRSGDMSYGGEEDHHYSRSQYIQRGHGDPDVRRLIEYVEELLGVGR